MLTQTSKPRLMPKIRRYSAGSQVSPRFTAANAAGQTHSYKASYDPQTGKFDLWRGGASLGTWTDTSSPLTTGGYISLRTDASNVLFDNFVMTRESKYYAAGEVRTCPESCRRVAMWRNASPTPLSPAPPHHPYLHSSPSSARS